MQGTSSESYGELTTKGPAVKVTVPVSGRVLVTVTSGIEASTGSESCFMGFAISGGDTVVPTDAHALILTTTSLQAASASYVVEGLTANKEDTFTAQYRASAAGKECKFSNRSMWAIPLP